MVSQGLKLVIICATQRSGSTMVVEDMRNTGVLGMPEEYFIPWDVNKEKINWLDNFDGILKKASSSNGVVAIKVMANQLMNIEKCLESAGAKGHVNEGRDALFPRFRELTKNAKFIFIRRDNILRQAISRSMSRQTGINHAVKHVEDEHFAGNLLKGYETSYNDAAVYRKEELLSEMLSITNENIVWEAFFRDWNISHPLSLRYEEICKNSPAYLQRIGKYVSVNIEESNQVRKMVKLSNEKNEKWYEKYLESIVEVA